MRVNGKPSPSKRISLFNILDANEGFITEKVWCGGVFHPAEGYYYGGIYNCYVLMDAGRRITTGTN